MVTYFNKKDLVSFGEYLLSDERRKRFEDSFKEKENALSVDEALQRVNHADIENWINK